MNTVTAAALAPNPLVVAAPMLTAITVMTGDFGPEFGPDFSGQGLPGPTQDFSPDFNDDFSKP